ncbi:MAG: GNAT family N-acetyltransferase [Candidatus Binatia bacterium]
MIRIGIAETDEEVLACFPTMGHLRRHLVRDEFLARIRRQERAGYRLAFLEGDGRVRAVAGFRILESLASGRFLYVDDLVSDPADRSKGYGGALFDWLVERARSEGCDDLELDSGVQRFGAHRFYLRKRMEISSHHFRLNLRP